MAGALGTARRSGSVETLQQIALRVAVGKTHGEVASELAITEGEVSRRMRDLRRAVRANIDAGDS